VTATPSTPANQLSSTGTTVHSQTTPIHPLQYLASPPRGAVARYPLALPGYEGSKNPTPLFAFRYSQGSKNPSSLVSFEGSKNPPLIVRACAISPSPLPNAKRPRRHGPSQPLHHLQFYAIRKILQVTRRTFSCFYLLHSRRATGANNKIK
jgi:hypothetical protein